jgi:hypothetical protein
MIIGGAMIPASLEDRVSIAGFMQNLPESRTRSLSRKAVFTEEELQGEPCLGTSEAVLSEKPRSGKYIHSKRMLESKQQGQENRHPILKAKKGGLLLGLLHKRKIGFEEEGYGCQPGRLKLSPASKFPSGYTP